MKILIVDDSRAMRMIVMRHLRNAGYGDHEINQAGDGVEALASIKENKPDLVLCDWNMPEMNGIDLLEALNTEGIELTFGFVTSEGTDEMRQRATDAGAKFLIAKPFTVEDFTEKLGALALV